MEDIVAQVMRQWQRINPELDTAPMAVIGRLNRCFLLIQQATDAPLRGHGLTRPEFDILGTLRRLDRELTPSQIARETFASGAAVTKRLRFLQERGLVIRRPDDRDRRVSHLSLTEQGRTIIDRMLPEQVGYDASLLSGLDAERQRELAGLLGELLLLLEGRLGARQP
ncbi:MarR family transcriptional regulator [Streptosporangium sp. NBC_01639]|uniref:MarR family winged helix-turn-helix transcriptional regulator n=1 Tax=unclassified Streptosporangium TaxID=2632669 RepID=UPI002DD8D678|nr:MarR family transcriptional regulator [Streptosporangium sp. NBC_01756]WSC84543.1 MarR family transcriptional regulator [Streptosporangium sp. NBC_01756]WTD56825.1 MarR family transcriptional regulator [Streptosporangium sp. NBC_01639]